MKFSSALRNRLTNPYTMGPVKTRMNYAREILENTPGNKLWYCGGYRSAAVAAQMLKNRKIIAIPTDTIYGLAGLAQSPSAIARLYEIKSRDTNKPLAICLSDIEDIDLWACTKVLPRGLVGSLLPGPVTLVLERKGCLNQSLNPGVSNIGIRVPANNFIRCIVKMLNEPIALTSANKSNTKSTLHPNEFKDLWPEIDGIFYEKMNMLNFKNSWRTGSTIVDLTKKGEFMILRKGIGFRKTMRILEHFNLTRRNQSEEVRTNEIKEIKGDGKEESEVAEDLEIRASA